MAVKIISSLFKTISDINNKQMYIIILTIAVLPILYLPVVSGADTQTDGPIEGDATTAEPGGTSGEATPAPAGAPEGAKATTVAVVTEAVTSAEVSSEAEAAEEETTAAPKAGSAVEIGYSKLAFIFTTILILTF